VKIQNLQFMEDFTMKRILTLACVALLALSLPVFATKSGGSPIIGGGTGVITTPTAYTIGAGGMDIGFYWVNPSSLAASIGFGFIDKLDLSFGFELDDDTGIDADPFLHIRGKYRFSGANRGQDTWAFGLDVALALGDKASSLSNPSSPAFTMYVVNSFFLASFQFNWGVGYTFGYDENINFMVGISKLIVQNFYIEADFSNYANRYFTQGSGAHANVSRGIGNIAARLHLFDGMLRLTLGVFDAFDSSREIGHGVALKLGF
jgi:hypothetical protein